MRTHAETAALLHQVSYPGFVLELRWRDACADFPDQRHNFAPPPRITSAERALRWTCPSGTCNVTGKAAPWNGRWWRLSEHMTDSEIVWTAFKAILTCLEHEAREKFLFKGVAVADSHVDIHKLADFMAQPSVKDSRA